MQFKSCFIFCLVLLTFVALAGQLVTWALHYFTVPVPYHGEPHPRGDLSPYPGATAENLWWFVQISDMHLTTVAKPEKTTRLRDFKQFCGENLKIIQPTLVLATGDITDGAPNNSENEADWVSYQSILQEANLPNSLIWLDVRGNHDNFDVPNPNHARNLYSGYSILGNVGDSSFLYELHLPSGTYSFVHVNALLNPGIRRPINFFGMIDQWDVSHLEVLSEMTEQASSNHTIFFGHYPTSVILSPSGLQSVLEKGIAYLCGHLHDLDTNPGIKKMYALQRYGSLELELEDWKKHRMYRVLAFDHDLLSFTDVHFGKWPVILITNPKSAQFLAPGHEPVNRMVHSTHIRFLIFSPHPIKYAKVAIDDMSHGLAHAVDGGPLFVMPWKPRRYGNGLHTISVRARDAAGGTTTASHVFSLDGSQPQQPFVSSFILMINGYLFFASCILVLVSACVLPLMFFRRYTEHPAAGVTSSALLYGILLLVHSDDIYFALISITLYPLVGPWLVGEVLGDAYGLLTLYGVYVNNTFVGDKFAMYFFMIDLLQFHIPLILFCILHLSRAFFCLPSKNGSGGGGGSGNHQARSSHRVADIVRIVISLFLLKPVLAHSFKRISAFNHFYGWVALLASPKYTWTSLVALYVGIRCVYVGCVGKRHAGIATKTVASEKETSDK